jgi:antitoxin (DNA-binding transcriptional repressor) of toxin-antitoxin stability system
MRTATIHELHMNTGKLVRAAAHEKIIITERGQPVALPKAVDGPDLVGKSFPTSDFGRRRKGRWIRRFTCRRIATGDDAPI